MTWDAFHRRGEILRDLIATAGARRDGTLPHRLADGTELYPDLFDDELDLVGALLLTWHARLSGNIERELARQPMDLEAAVVRAWARTADEGTGVRLVLDQHIAHPLDARMGRALARARHKEWVRLAAAAGLACDQGRAAAEAGHRIELAARERCRRAAPTPRPANARRTDPPCAGSFVERLRAALVA